MEVEHRTIIGLSTIPIILLFIGDHCPAKARKYVRKLIHISTGLLYSLVNPPVEIVVPLALFVLALIARWHPKVAQMKGKFDIGITGYCISLVIISSLKIPPSYMLPLFLSDPIGFLVGYSVPSPSWYRQKTILGSLGVLLSCYLVTWNFTPMNSLHCCVLSLAVTLVEALGAEYDNLAIFAVLLVNHQFF
jgi:dolichol kinase